MDEVEAPGDSSANPLPGLPDTLPALTSEDLARLELRLQKQQAELLAGIARLNGQATPSALAPAGAGGSPRPRKAGRHAARDATPLAILRGELAQTRLALAHLDGGTYGRCEAAADKLRPLA
jgi:hypothetical protein